MPPAARISDMHVCPMSDGPKPHVGGPITKGQANVVTVGMPQARVTDMCTCVGPIDIIAMGSATVHVGGLMAARMFDQCAHGGTIVTGMPNVDIGGFGMGVPGLGTMSMLLPRMFAEGGAVIAAKFVQVLLNASKEGAAFVEQCLK